MRPDRAATVPGVTSALLADLDARGLIHATTDRVALSARLDAGPVTLYAGFDPTADSLHLGHLVPLLLLRRFQLAGHRPIALAGGATGMVGDPGGRSSERNLLEAEELRANTEAIRSQLGRFLDFGDGPSQAQLVDNLDWTAPMGVIEFLRDVGKHMTVQQMLARDAVRSRLESEHGISFTEFSYMLLQANDYAVLHREYGCELQVAGSDQWGNIVSGVDLIRRRSGAHVHALVAPLITRTDGQKFGKSVDGALWLDPSRTRPFQMYQYLVQVADDDVASLLWRLTLVSVDEIADVMAAHSERPHRRLAQRRLADEVVGLVHGDAVAASASAATDLIFGGEPLGASLEVLNVLAEELPIVDAAMPAEGIETVALLVASGLAKSKGEARRNPAGYSVNGRTLGDAPTVDDGDLLHGCYLLLRRGKSSYAIARFTGNGGAD